MVQIYRPIFILTVCYPDKLKKEVIEVGVLSAIIKKFEGGERHAVRMGSIFLDVLGMCQGYLNLRYYYVTESLPSGGMRRGERGEREPSGPGAGALCRRKFGLLTGQEEKDANERCQNSFRIGSDR